jgi:hypothetical protein
MIIDVDAVNYLNETSITEVVSSDVSLAIGILFIFIGVVLLLKLREYIETDKRKLRRF